MLEEMLRKILAKLCEMPLLNLSEENLNRFFDITNTICINTTYEQYLRVQTTEDADRLWLWEKSKIEKYLKNWPQLALDIGDMMNAIALTWNELYKSTMGSDILLDILVEIMPRDRSYLAKLSPLFRCAAKVNSAQATNNSFTQLDIAAHYYLENLQTNQPDQHAEKYMAVIRRLQNANHFAVISLLNIFINVFEARMLALATLIHVSLTQDQHHDYGWDNEISNKDLLIDTCNSKILLMLENIDEPPFNEDNVLTQRIEAYVAYKEMHDTIFRRTPSVLRKLSEVLSKFRLFQPLIQKDLDNLQLEPCETIQRFLNIPTPQNSPFFLFSSAPIKISFSQLIDFAETKTHALDAAREQAHSTPNLSTVSALTPHL